jgi:hypothetical protein
VNGFDATSATVGPLDAATCLSSARTLRKKLRLMVAFRAVMSAVCGAVVALLFLLPKFDKQHNKVVRGGRDRSAAVVYDAM